MNRKSLLCISIILLIVTVDFSYGQKGESGKGGNSRPFRAGSGQEDELKENTINTAEITGSSFTRAKGQDVEDQSEGRSFTRAKGQDVEDQSEGSSFTRAKGQDVGEQSKGTSFTRGKGQDVEDQSEGRSFTRGKGQDVEDQSEGTSFTRGKGQDVGEQSKGTSFTRGKGQDVGEQSKGTSFTGAKGQSKGSSFTGAKGQSKGSSFTGAKGQSKGSSFTGAKGQSKGSGSYGGKGVGGKDYSNDDYGYGVGDPYPSYGGSGKGYNGGGLDGYYGDGGYGGKNIIGYEGKDPRRDGIDIGDYGPIFGRLDNMTSKLNVWISAADDWDRKGSGRYGSNKYGSNKYGSDKYGSDKYDSDDYGSDNYGSGNNYRNNQRRRRSYNKVTFPVKQIKNYKKFPFFRFPPLISIAPWLPIFYDKLTYQTFIFSLTGGLYIIPPLINFYGQRFAVAQLIKWGYASLVSSGVPPPPAVNVAPLVQPGPPPPPPTGNVAPKYEKGAVKTDYPAFRPRPDYLQKSVNDGPSNQAPGPYSG